MQFRQEGMVFSQAERYLYHLKHRMSAGNLTIIFHGLAEGAFQYEAWRRYAPMLGAQSIN